jgi:hypothetical protein
MARVLLLSPVFIAGLIALLIGVVDTVAPASLPSQLVGLTYLAAGVVATGGAVAVVQRRAPVRQIATVAVLAAAYVWGTLALYAYALRPAEAVAGAVLFAVTLIAGSRVAGWRSSAGGGPGGAGIADRPGAKQALRLRVSAAAIGTVIAAAQLWYSSVYLPANADVGIAFSVTPGTPLRVSKQLRLVPLQITLQNQSSVGAVALTSMFTVFGVGYQRRGHLWRPRTDTLIKEQAIGAGALQSEQDNNVGFAPGRPETLLAMGRVAGDGRILFPSVAQSTRVVVAVPPGVNALEVHVQLDYARDTRLQLAGADPTTGLGGTPYARYTTAVADCPHDVIEIRTLRQSLLQRLTRGDQILVTNWCFEPGHERTFSFVSTRPGGFTSTVNSQSSVNYRRQLRLVHPLTRHDTNTYGIVHVGPVWTLAVG